MSEFFVSNKQISKFNLHYRDVPVSPEGVHFGVITYGRTVYKDHQIKLDEATTVDGLLTILNAFAYLKGKRKI